MSATQPRRGYPVVLSYTYEYIPVVYPEKMKPKKINNNNNIYNNNNNGKSQFYIEPTSAAQNPNVITTPEIRLKL